MYQMSQGYACQGCGSGLSYSRNYSKLESTVNYSASASSGIRYSVSASVPEFSVMPSIRSDYTSSFQSGYTASTLGYDLFKSEKNYQFVPDNFLREGNWGGFVGSAEEIKELVEETFELMFHQPFPNDIKVSVLSEERFKKLAPHPGTLGLSINRREHGMISEIFVKKDVLARVLLTFGHELGHVLTSTLDHAQDEEAKAYAFSLAWMRTIKEHNIAGLKNAIITENPADNGLHNVAFFFVEQLHKSGKSWWDIYQKLIGKNLSVAG